MPTWWWALRPNGVSLFGGYPFWADLKRHVTMGSDFLLVETNRRGPANKRRHSHVSGRVHTMNERNPICAEYPPVQVPK